MFKRLIAIVVFLLGILASVLFPEKFLWTLKKADFVVYEVLLLFQPIPDGLITEAFVVDLVIWAPRGIQANVFLFCFASIVMISMHVSDYFHRPISCGRCGEKRYEPKWFFYVSKLDNSVCLECYWELEGRTDKEYLSLKDSEEQQMSYERWVREEILLNKRTQEWKEEVITRFEDGEEEEEAILKQPPLTPFFPRSPTPMKGRGEDFMISNREYEDDLE